MVILQQDTNKKIRADRVKELKDAKDQAEAKSKKQIEENNKKIQALQKRVCFKSWWFVFKWTTSLLHSKFSCSLPELWKQINLFWEFFGTARQNSLVDYILYVLWILIINIHSKWCFCIVSKNTHSLCSACLQIIVYKYLKLGHSQKLMYCMFFLFHLQLLTSHWYVQFSKYYIDFI